MKPRSRVLLAVLGIGSLVVAIAGFRLVHQRLSPFVAPGRPQTSPSGTFEASCEERPGPHHRFRITNSADGRAVQLSPDFSCSWAHALFATWGERDEFWVYSGDIGLYIFEPVADGSWPGRPHTTEKLPPIIREILPRVLGGKR